MSTAPTPPLLLSQAQLTLLVLSSIKVELSTDFIGAMLRYQMCRGVADIIVSLTGEQIQMLASLSGAQNIVRLTNGNSPSFWADLCQSLVHRDALASSLALVQSLMSGVPAAAHI